MRPRGQSGSERRPPNIAHLQKNLLRSAPAKCILKLGCRPCWLQSEWASVSPLNCAIQRPEKSRWYSVTASGYGTGTSTIQAPLSPGARSTRNWIHSVLPVRSPYDCRAPCAEKLPGAAAAWATVALCAGSSQGIDQRGEFLRVLRIAQHHRIGRHRRARAAGAQHRNHEQAGRENQAHDRAHSGCSDVAGSAGKVSMASTKRIGRRVPGTIAASSSSSVSSALADSADVRAAVRRRRETAAAPAVPARPGGSGPMQSA